MIRRHFFKASISILGLVLLSATSASSQETLFCVAELSTGFVWKDNRWETATFNVLNDKYIVKPVPELDKGPGSINYQVTKMGEKLASHECYRDKFNNKLADQIACGGLGYGFVVNFTTLRFQDFYGLGYISGNDALGNTPSLTIGKCSKL